MQITQASNWQAKALANRAIEDKHSTEAWSPSELTTTPTPGVTRVFYAAVSKGPISGVGVHITLQHDDSCGEVFSGSFFLTNCDFRIAEVQASGCALLLLSALLCSLPPTPANA